MVQEIKLPCSDRIAGAMTAFAAGDALGVPWEGSAPAAIDRSCITELPAARWGWPRGATSDDTAQMLLVAELLADTAGPPTAEGFMARLVEAAESIRGIGPTTARALDHFRATGDLPEPEPGERATNGAAMRMLPVGWITPTTDPDRRRQLVEVLAIATHRAPAAIVAAGVVAAMASWAMDGVGVEAIIAAASTEIDAWAEKYDEADGFRAGLADTWIPGIDGVSLDATQTVAGVLHVLRTEPDLTSALPYAVSLGGDTDTVAALVGGILGARVPDQVNDLNWLQLVEFDQPSNLILKLHELRKGLYNR